MKCVNRRTSARFRVGHTQVTPLIQYWERDLRVIEFQSGQSHGSHATPSNRYHHSIIRELEWFTLVAFQVVYDAGVSKPDDTWSY